MSDQFGKWLRESMPEAVEDRVRSEVHLAVLKERLRSRKMDRRKHRTRLGMIAVPVVLIALFSTNLTELGGDGFELEEIGDSKTPGGTVKNEFRDVGFNYSNIETEEEMQEFNHQIASGEGVVVGVTGWRIFGKTKWTIQTEYNIFGKSVETGSSPQSPDSDIPPELQKFLDGHWEIFDSKIKSGESSPSGEMVKKFDGVFYTVQYWSLPTEQFGTVTYFSGEPIQ